MICELLLRIVVHTFILFQPIRLRLFCNAAMRVLSSFSSPSFSESIKSSSSTDFSSLMGELEERRRRKENDRKVQRME